MLKALAVNGLALEHAAEELQNDKEVVLVALESKWQAFRFASDLIRCDKEVVLFVVDWTVHALDVAPSSIRNDKSIILRALDQSWEAFRYASSGMRRDPDVVHKTIFKLREAAEMVEYRPSLNRVIFDDFGMIDSLSVGRSHPLWQYMERTSPLCAIECLLAQLPAEICEFLQNYVEKEVVPEFYVLVLEPLSGDVARVIIDSGSTTTSSLKMYLRGHVQAMLTDPNAEIKFLLGLEELEDDVEVKAWPGVQAGGMVNIVNFLAVPH